MDGPFPIEFYETLPPQLRAAVVNFLNKCREYEKFSGTPNRISFATLELAKTEIANQVLELLGIPLEPTQGEPT